MKLGRATTLLAPFATFAIVTSAVAQTPSVSSRAVEPAGSPVQLGPYPVVIEADPSLSTHTIYRPADLTATGLGQIPIVVWGNGGCMNNGTMFLRALTKMASHGFVILAIGPITHVGDYPGATIVRLPDSDGGAAARNRPAGMGSATQASQLIDALDWAISENGREGSRYRGRLDPSRVAVMGQSCGGLQALEVAADPRITTMVIWNSGVFNSPAGRSLAGATKEGLADIHSTIAYINGGPSDIAYENSNDDVSRINHVPLFYGVMNEAGHAATFSHVNGGRFAEVGANWLLWRLRGDEEAGRLFSGPDCGLCTDPEWTVQKKSML